MKSIALFALILVGASSSAQNSQDYFMKLSPSDTVCTYHAEVIEYANKFYVQSKSARQQISKIISTSNDRVKDLVLQCENAKRQALQDNVSDVIVNVQTGEVYPEQGFLVKRQATELERQK